MTVTARYDDAMALQRYTYSFRVHIEQRLVGSWWLIAAPRVRFADYSGSDAGRHDRTMSFVGGLKHEFNDNVSFTTLAGVEDRDSNVASKIPTSSWPAPASISNSTSSAPGEGASRHLPL